MAKQVIPVEFNKKRFTIAEREKRLAAEQALQARSDKIRCPSWLDDDAKKEWRRLVHELKEIGLLTNLDQSSLAICCDCYSKYMAATNKINDTMLVGVHTNKHGAKNLVVNPYVMVAQKYADMYKKYCVEIGLTPNARMRMTTAAQAEPEKDELIDFIKRRQRNSS